VGVRDPVHRRLRPGVAWIWRRRELRRRRGAVSLAWSCMTKKGEGHLEVEQR
jgi:hypothetical protein